MKNTDINIYFLNISVNFIFIIGLSLGSGDLIPLGSVAKVHYRGTLEDGTVFDTSRTRGKPFKFTVGSREVILGWDKGVAT
jgi:FKBP-type peptidyl-prolyl cis-trans isomerase